MDWQRAQQQTREQNERTSGPRTLRPRRNTRLDGWIENKTAKFTGTCDTCQEHIRLGEAVQLKPPAPLHTEWRMRHEACSPPG